MRLIDADALKEVFKETDVHYGGKIKELIDEAPTMEQKYYERVVANVTFDRDQLNEIVEKAKAEVLESIKTPHGEWEVLSPSLTGDKFSIFHKYIQDILGRPVWTHELADSRVWEEIKEKSRNDFLTLCREETKDDG